MKRLLVLVPLLLLSAVAASADTTFSSTLSADEASAAGIDALTPEQLARLNEFVDRYKSAEVTREVGKAVEETRANEANRDDWKEPKAPKKIETKLAGAINGWTGGTLFHFANGQIWRPSNNESYRHYKTVQEPAVVLEKSPVIGYWMYIDGFPRVRVKRVE